MRERKVRYMVEDAAPFSVHGAGLTIQAVTRKSEVPVTIEYSRYSLGKGQRSGDLIVILLDLFARRLHS